MELLAPAGGMAALQAAVENGADAVYLGGSAFGARANAVNFTNEELSQAVAYAHLRGVAVHVTLNTLLHDAELPAALAFAAHCANIGVDALIVQDVGLAALLREHIPALPLHASTQMTIDSLDGVETVQKLGFSRAVLARELSCSQVAHICAHTDMEIEVFVHGALCVSYSGQCLLSSMLGGCSGNRGACKQPCRLPYTVLDAGGRPVGGEGRYWLSPKDQCLIDDMADLAAMGVKSLKIEGRMKGPGYVGAVTRMYDKYRQGGAVSPVDRAALTAAFSRGGSLSRGHFGSVTGRDFLSYQSHNDHLHGGAPLPKTPVNTRKIPVFGEASIQVGRPLELSLWDGGGHHVSVTGEAAEPARTLPLTAERVREQLGKCGGTPFVLQDLQLDISDNASLPMKALNAARRAALEDLAAQRTAVGRAPVAAPHIVLPRTPYSGKLEFTAEISTAEQAESLAGCGFARVYVPHAVWAANPAVQALPNVWVTLPAAGEPGKFVQNMTKTGKEISNLRQLFIHDGPKHAGMHLNTFNSASMAEWKRLGFASVCLSPELNLSEIRSISKELPTECYIYGHLPVMTTRHCPLRAAAGKCTCGGAFYRLRDRKGMEFPVKPDPAQCISTIYNANPLYMADRMSELAGAGLAYGRFLFTTERPDEIPAIVQAYRTAAKREGGYTRGHFYRGV